MSKLQNVFEFVNDTDQIYNILDDEGLRIRLNKTNIFLKYKSLME